MYRTSTIFLVFVTFFGTLCQQAPAFTRQFEVGTLYIYDYETSVLLNEPQAVPVSSAKDVGFRIEMKAEITPVWQHPSNNHEQILQLTVASPKLSVKSRQGPTPEGFVQKQSKLDGYKLHPLYLHWNDGQIGKVYHIDGEELSVLNVMKGISSLFQHQVKNAKQTELDASGKCEVTYKLIDSTRVTKIKKNCKTVVPVVYFNHTSKVLGAQVDSQATTTYILNPDDKILQKATAIETHFLRSELRRKSGAEVLSNQVLSLKSRDKVSTPRYTGKNEADAIASISRNLKKSLVTGQLATKPDAKECIACKALKDLVHNFRSTLAPKNLGTQGSAIAFLRLLKKVRESDLDTLKAVLKDKKNAKILPQLLDIVAAAQTLPAHKAAMSLVKFNGPIDNAERYLLAVSLATHPPEFIIKDILSLAKKGHNNDKLYETMVLTLSSLSHTFCKIGTNCKKPIMSEVRKFIVDSLDACTTESCKLIFIRGLKNLRMANTVDVLLDHASGKEHKPAVYAMRALQTMPESFITEKILKKLERVFLQLDRQYDSSVRIMAVDILLQHHPSDELLEDILSSMSFQDTKELNTVLLGRIRDLANSNPHIEQLLKKTLKISEFNNYHILAQGGLSSAFSRSLAESENVNSSFSNILEISGGLLKRSTVDVFVDGQDSRMRLLSIGIFAGGLSMFGGDEAVDDGEEANAGIELALLDTQLRPFIFFTGQGELMGHVWSGTGSERTTALQGSFLLQDHSQILPLQNGMNAELLLNGAISYDFSGQVQISLWNRNARSLVEVGASMVMQGVARVDNSFVQSLIEFNTGGQAQLNFITDLDFYDEIMMCLKMVQPDMNIVTSVRKLERLPGTNYVLRKYKRKSSPVPGKTYVMNKKNTELCTKMFKK
ncbi:microsomal triglyceride transfer protein large subunit isoform X2 [Palaemon carinicauda]|uniref:microsomal triglyceride transfer protein large subunit isoform X2 n=1 Tax=Palaemon carinicauda TaxID=392227 RepID=UPI0035B66757